MIPNRLKKLQVSSQFIELMLTKGEKHYQIEDNTLPDDVRLVNIISDSGSFPTLWFIFESESWPELKDGSVIPEIQSPIFRKL